MEAQVAELDMEMLQLPRKRRVPKRFDKEDPVSFASVTDMYSDLYTSAYRIAAKEIERRFSQEGIRKYIEMENVILNPLKGNPVDQEALKSLCCS